MGRKKMGKYHQKIGSVSFSPTGKRAIMEARGEIFTIPVENGDPRNITKSSGNADRAPVWSPKGNKVAWFSDKDIKDMQCLLPRRMDCRNQGTFNRGI